MLLAAAGASDGATEDSREVVQASVILAAIEQGEPVDYDGVIVEGDLDLSGLDLPTEHVEWPTGLPVYFEETEHGFVIGRIDLSVAYLKLVNSSINITNSEIRGNVMLGNSIFQEQVCFENSNFTGDAWFSGSNFSENANFWGAKFSGGNASFMYAYFSDGDAIFSHAKFSGGDADFSNAKFSGGDADFSGAEFSGGYADFSRTEFSGGNASFFVAKFFGDYAHFGSATFSGGDAEFWGAEFSGDTNFKEVRFNGSEAIFVETRFNDTADFEEVQFDKEAYFNDAQFNGTTDFTSIWFKEDAFFENATFRGELFLTKARYNKLFIRWYNLEGGLAYDDTAYLTLLNNFKELGYFEDYDCCYFEYRKIKRSQPWLLVGDLEETLIRKPIDWFLQVTYGYGTKPLNALFFSLGIIIGFGAFWRLIGLGRPDEALDEYILADAEHDSILEVLAFSATVFLSGTRLFIEPPPLPKIGGRSRTLIRGAFILERVLGALFSILFFLAISGTVVRQL